MNQPVSRVRVEIFGEEFIVRGDTDADYIVRLAKMVDQKMREVSETLEKAETKKIAILAALNLADELVQSEEKGQATGDIEERTKRLISMLDEGIIGDYY